MKLRQKFVLRNIADTYILVPVIGENDNFDGVISLNETGAFIWNELEKNNSAEQIAKKMVLEYEITYSDALSDINNFCNDFKKIGIIE